MQFSGLNGGGARKQRAGAKKVEPKTLVMRLNEVVIAPGKPGVFEGVNIETNEPIRVRMMTVDEGTVVNVRGDESLDDARKRVQAAYVGTDAAHRPRPQEVATKGQKVFCDAGGLLMFTKVLPSPGDEGLLMAHWVETLAAEPGAACEKVRGHLSAGTVQGASYAYVDAIDPKAATVLTPDNAVDTLLAAFDNQKDGVQRKPFVLLRLLDENNNVVTGLPETRVSAATIKDSITDPDTGTVKDVYTIGSAQQTLERIVDPATEDRHSMIMRAVIAGLNGDEGYPDYSKASPDMRQDLHSIVDAIKDGSIRAEVIPGERINAGPATRASLIASAANPKSPVNFYTGSQWFPQADGTREEQKVHWYKDIYVTKKEGQNGYQYFIKANDAEQEQPKQSVFSLVTENSKGFAKTVTVEVAATNEAAQDPADELLRAQQSASAASEMSPEPF